MKFLKYGVLIVAIMVLTNCAAISHKSDSIKTIDICEVKTNYGTMKFKFFEDAAPLTTAKFKGLVNDGFYDSLLFYRVVKDHVIQAGDGGENNIPTVVVEFNKHPHVVGTVGLARSEDPNSGNTEFYICHIPRPHLDGKYTVFGQLIDGYDVLEIIANMEIVEQFVGDEGNIAFLLPKIR